MSIPRPTKSETERLRREVEDLKEQMAADINFMKAKGQELKAANQRIEELEGALRECLDQAKEGLRVNHDCPAVYALSVVLNEAYDLIGGEDGDTGGTT